MIPVGSFAITTEDIHTLDNCLKKGSRVKILDAYVVDQREEYTIENENGWQIFSVWSDILKTEVGDTLRVVLQPLSGLSDEEYDKLFSVPAQQKGKTELEILREYIRQVQIIRR